MQAYMKHSSKVESDKETLAANPLKEYICTHVNEHRYMSTNTFLNI